MAGSSYVVMPSTEVDFQPATVGAEVVQNVRTIVATQVGTVPLHRAFGTSWDAVDKPIPVARQLIRSAVVDAVRRFEPRAQVTGIEWDETAAEAMDGIGRPVVSIDVENGDESLLVEADTVSLVDVYVEADRCVQYAGELLAAMAETETCISELEATVYDEVFTAGYADERDRLLFTVEPMTVDAESTCATDSACAFIDAAAEAAAKVVAAVNTCTRRLVEIEKVDYKKIFDDGLASGGTPTLQTATPAAVEPVSRSSTMRELRDAAVAAYESCVAAMAYLDTLRRRLAPIEQTSYKSIYGGI